MRLGVFTDSHYSSAEITCGKRYNREAFNRISNALSFFCVQKCDVIICLGDLIDKEIEHSKEVENLKRISDLFSKCEIPIYVLMGNHDAFAFNVDEFYDILGTKCRPINLYNESCNLIFLDACYFKNGKHYKPGDSDWTDTFLKDIDALEKTIKEASGDTHIFIHQNIDPSVLENHRIFNDVCVRSIFENSGKVKTVFQGHYHPGKNSELNGIKYMTFPALCENENAYYIIGV